MSKAKEERNKAIKWRWEHDKDKRGIQVLMARQYGISKQAISVICNRPDPDGDSPVTHHRSLTSILNSAIMKLLRRVL